MKLSDEIIRMIAAAKFVIAPVTDASNLYADLGYDSLAFIRLLVELEEAYCIRFELMEMEMCLQTGQLIALVEQKVKESGNDKAFIGRSKALGKGCRP